MMRRNLIRLGLVLAIVLMMLLSILPARAGWNGQQLQFYSYSGAGLAWLQISGTNQNGQWTTWTGYFVGQRYFSLYGWWWKGYTYARWMLNDGRTGQCGFNVPGNQNSDWVGVGYARYSNGDGCWVG